MVEQKHAEASNFQNDKAPNLRTFPKVRENWWFYSQILLRGLRKLCPNCGVGSVIRGYLNQSYSCKNCGERFNHISADDGPAWLTLFVVGHLLAPMLFFFGTSNFLAVWQIILLLSSFALVAIYFLLPRVKGFFIAVIWLTGATGENTDGFMSENKENGKRFL